MKLPIILMSEDKGLTAVAKYIMNGCISCVGSPITEKDTNTIWRALLLWKSQYAETDINAMMSIDSPRFGSSPKELSRVGSQLKVCS
eukprot:CAMPEP_0196585012 /NCGR_PEP_ID=MMETSP1081-20130531/49321_1 /TAXON_ID=36882 /ORGANISM="Pyramimonas amylifera, Strain CCMP720" /LENGTH=86 /DNA_ID=CAMNT_0041906417 /DNA_START=824 /DNA_END=1087 /DNA_ORIENTATION=-